MTSHYRNLATAISAANEFHGSYVVESGVPNMVPSNTINSTPEEIEGYDEVFDPALDPLYECPICINCLRDPMQTECGHRFCKYCIEKHMRINGPKCPCDNQKIEQVFPDNFAKREINLFPVRCRTVLKNKKCPWKGELQKLPTHMQLCGFVEVPCPNACGISIERNMVDVHLVNECAKRKVVCIHCKIELLHKKYKDHLEKCPKAEIQCPQCEKTLTREKLAGHTQTECPKAKAFCDFKEHGCKWTGIRSDVASHLQKDTQNHLRILANAVSKLGKAGGAQKTSSKAMEILTRQSAENGDAIRTMRGKIDQLERSTREQVDRFEQRFSELGAEIETFKATTSEMTSRMCNGVFLWRINNYSKQVDEAKRGQLTAVHSPPFYTDYYGYKFCLRVNPNGVDTGFGTHISLFLHMMQSEWDDILEWPFSGRITMSILDQGTDDEYKRHITEALVTRPSLLAFRKPTTPRNHKGYGYVEFAPLETLQTRLYIKNDSLLVRVVITRK